MNEHSALAPSPFSRPSVPMPANTPSGQPSTVAGMLPTPGIELGQISGRLSRTLGERFSAPPDDPIHAGVEIVHAIEMVAIHINNATAARTQREGELLGLFDRAFAEIVALAAGERATLSKEVLALAEATRGNRSAYDEARPLIEGLPALQVSLQDDVNARARERWGQGVILLVTALAFLVVGILATVLFFNKYVLVPVSHP